MIKYKNYKIECIDKFKSVIMNLNDENLLENGKLITNSMGSDIFDDFYGIKEEVEKYIAVLNGDVLECEGGGNINSIVATKEYTVLEELLEDEDEETICKIETVEFVKLVLIWAEANFRFKNKCSVIDTNEMSIALQWVKEQWKFIERCESEHNK